MRLYDKIMAAPGTLLDRAYYGTFTNLARGLKQAQCFILEPDIASACEEVCYSKPSSMLSAYKFLRTPYPHMWIEWTPNDRIKERTRINDKPRPIRMGCYIESNAAGTKGTIMYLWEHRKTLFIHSDDDLPEITPNPFGIIFDFVSEEPVMVQYAQSVGLNYTKEDVEKRDSVSREKFRESMITGNKWNKFAHDERELDAYMELDKSSGIIPLEVCKDLFLSNLGKNLHPGHPMFESYMEDLAGEFAYTEAFLLMLNTRNKVVSQTREDLSRLNKARAKKRKMPLKEFIITNLNLNKSQQTHAHTMGIDRAAARRHLVRGHFKTRASGTYWYSAHLRGHSENSPIARKEYHVKL